MCENSNKSNSTGFYVKTSLQYGDLVEFQHNNSTSTVKGRRLLTQDMCAIFYDMDNISFCINITVFFKSTTATLLQNTNIE